MDFLETLRFFVRIEKEGSIENKEAFKGECVAGKKKRFEFFKYGGKIKLFVSVDLWDKEEKCYSGIYFIFLWFI